MSAAFDFTQDAPQRKSFMGWQCRVRQIMMRETQGKPDKPIIADVYANDQSLCMITTVLVREMAYSVLPEMQHMYLHTNDPQIRRNKAIEFFSATYYQKQERFSDILCATFVQPSDKLAALVQHPDCELRFDAWGQEFIFNCEAQLLGADSHFAQATLAHNRLFNDRMDKDIRVVGFTPNWDQNWTS